ncbi:MAG: histidine kinase [Thermonemataceae bacterium]|nr:histidine kinase [Thermonemataceae bacterium]
MSKLFYRSWIGLLLYFFVLNASGQYPYIKSLDSRYGINIKVIYDLHLDKQGLIWIGSAQGLFRFNGRVAKKIYAENSQQADITNLKTDSSGRLWGMNFSNQIFYLEKDTLRIFPLKISKGSIVNFDFIGKDLWIGLNSGFLKYSLEDFQQKQSYFSESVFTDFVASGTEFIGVSQYILLKARKEQINIVKTFTPYETRLQKVGGKVFALSNKLSPRNFYDTQQPQIVKSFAIKENIYILHYREFLGKILLCSKRGAYLLDPTTEKIENLFNEKQITDIIQDYQGNIWVSTVNEGLWFCPSLQTKYFLSQNGKHFESIEKINENLWVGNSEGELWKLQPKDTMPQWKYLSKVSDFSEIKKIKYNPLDHSVFLGTSITNQEGKVIQEIDYFKDVAFAKQEDCFFYLFALPYGARWLSFKPCKTFDEVALQKNENKYIYEKYIRFQRSNSVAIHQESQRYWVGYNDNLYAYQSNKESKILRSSLNQAVIAKQLIYYAPKNWLIVATFEQGLFIFKNDVVQNIFKNNMLKSTIIRKILLKDNKLWIGTDKEISVLDLDNLLFTDFFSQVGLSQIDYQDFCIDNEGLWLLQDNSVIFLPYELQRKRNILQILPPQIAVTKQTLMIAVETLNFKNPYNTTIWYRIPEVHREWRSLEETAGSTIHYDYLSGGSYTLEIYAEDKRANLKSRMSIMKLEIPLLWWQKWWNWLFISFILLGISNLVLFWGFKYYQQRQKLYTSLWISQLKTLQSQMNPHFLYNILYTAQALIYEDKKTEVGTLLGDFSDLMRKILENSEKLSVSLEDEITYLKLYLGLESIRFEDDFNYQIKIAENIHSHHQLLPSMLLQPFVENALKHGLMHKKGEKTLDINFYDDNGSLIVEIKDNGIGRKKSQELQQSKYPYPSVGFGTKSTLKRIEILNKISNYYIHCDIIDYQNPTGTLVIIHIKSKINK